MHPYSLQYWSAKSSHILEEHFIALKHAHKTAQYFMLGMLQELKKAIKLNSVPKNVKNIVEQKR